MKGYLVIQLGIYRHAIWGIRYSIEAAKALGEEMLALECDDYHRAEVVEIEMDEELPSTERVIGCVIRNDVRDGDSADGRFPGLSPLISSLISWEGESSLTERIREHLR